MMGRPKALLELTSDEKEQLERWVRRRKSAQGLALRSQIVLSCATERQAMQVQAALADRLDSVGLRLHPDKTKIVCAPRALRERLVCR